jgi:hypothetical protein
MSLSTLHPPAVLSAAPGNQGIINRVADSLMMSFGLIIAPAARSQLKVERS